MLDEEIKKYAAAKRSDKVHQAYKSWIDKKKCASPKLPSHSEARARPLTCFKEEVIHDFHRKQLSKRVQEKIVSPRPRQFSPRLQLERVRKIQELRNTITSRDVIGQMQPRDTPIISSKPRDIGATRRSRDITLETGGFVSTASAPTPRVIEKAARELMKSEEESKPGIKFSPRKDDDLFHYRISKLAEPKQPCSRKKRRKKKSSQQPPGEPLYYPVRIDNYFSPTSSTPDSGFVEDPVSPSPDNPNRLDVSELNKLEIASVHSEESREPEKQVEELSNIVEKPEVVAKSVRFNDSISYDTEQNSVSFGNSSEHLRSCIKVRNVHKM